MEIAEQYAMRSQQLVKLITPYFAGEHPAIVAATLADLMATLLAGHKGESEEDTIKMRANALSDIITLIAQLVPLNEQQRKSANEESHGSRHH